MGDARFVKRIADIFDDYLDWEIMKINIEQEQTIT